MNSAPESIHVSLHSFFEAAATDLEMTVENLTLVSSPQSRNQSPRGAAKVLSFTTSVLLPTLTSLFQHLGKQNYGVDILGKNEKAHWSSHPPVHIVHIQAPDLCLSCKHGYCDWNSCLISSRKLDEQLVSTSLKSFRGIPPPIPTFFIFKTGFHSASQWWPQSRRSRLSPSLISRPSGESFITWISRTSAGPSVCVCELSAFLLGALLSFIHHLVSPVGRIQLSCYRILNSLLSLGTSSSFYVEGYFLFSWVCAYHQNVLF